LARFNNINALVAPALC